MAYAGGGAVVIVYAIVIVASLVGVIVYPVLALLFGRPNKWKVKLGYLLLFYATAFTLVFAPRHILGYLDPNVDFYGVILDMDGDPVPNVEVTTRNCTGRKIFKADEKGVVNISVRCQSIFILEKIYNPNTGLYCLSSWDTDSNGRKQVALFGKSAKMFNGLGGWNDYDSLNPFRFECIWERPEAIVESRVNGDDWYIMGDGRVYTLNVTFDKERERLQEGEHDGQLRLRVFVNADDNPEDVYNDGRIIIEPVAGGIQIVRKHTLSIAPKTGYSDQYVYDFEKKKHIWERFYFYSHDGGEYGYIILNIDPGRRDGDVRVSADYVVNMKGGRAVLSSRD